MENLSIEEALEVWVVKMNLGHVVESRKALVSVNASVWKEVTECA